MIKEKEWWYCPNCKQKGQYQYEKHAGVMEVIYIIKDSHKKESPKCTGTVNELVISKDEPDLRRNNGKRKNI